MESRRRLIGVLAVPVLLLAAALAVSCQGESSGQAPPPTPPVVNPTTPANTPAVPVQSNNNSATENCTTCHDSGSTLKAMQVQYAASAHGSGVTFERNGKDCAICHTSQGFVERHELGSVDISGAIQNPAPVNCRTCHEIHETYTEDDWALRVSAPVKMELIGETIDMGATGNTCATCHQPRWGTPIPQVGGGEVKITSERWGPHYGTEGVIVPGKGGYGPAFTGMSVHSATMVRDGCATCHMADAYGAQSGGHTMSMSYEYHGSDVQNVAGCTSCHAGMTDFNRNDLQTRVEAKYDELKKLLVGKGIMTEAGYAVPGTYSSAEAGALWNYLLIKYDNSSGVHNPQYVLQLLQVGIDALK